MDQPSSPPPPSPAERTRPIGRHPLLGWRGLLLVIVVLLFGIPFFRGLLGTDAPPPTSAPAEREPPPTVTALAPASAAAASIGAAAAPPDSIDQFGATKLCEAAAIAELDPDGEAQALTSQSVVSFDQAAQTMQVRVPIPYTKDGAERRAFAICDVQMQDEWRRGTVTSVQIAEASP